MVERHESSDDDVAVGVDSEKRPYTSPNLTEFGSVSSLTRGGAVTTVDGQSGSAGNQSG